MTAVEFVLYLFLGFIVASVLRREPVWARLAVTIILVSLVSWWLR